MKPSQGHTLVVPDEFHSTCFVCGNGNPGGIRLQFLQLGDHLHGEVVVDDRFHGYEGIVHGGIVASILDAAMVRCLHAAFGKDPYTCRLDVRYFREAPIGHRIAVDTHVTSHRRNMCWAEAEMLLGLVRCAHASGIFKLV